jgi:hypothetical protein
MNNPDRGVYLGACSEKPLSMESHVGGVLVSGKDYPDGI